MEGKNNYTGVQSGTVLPSMTGATVQIQQKATAKEQLGAWLGADCVG